jgi:hypothetical protein
MITRFCRTPLRCWSRGGLLALAFLVLPPELSAAPPGELLTIDQLIEGMRTIDNAFAPPRCFRVQYTQHTVPFDAKGNPIPARESTLKVDYARKGDMLYCLVNRKATSIPDLIPSELITWRDNVCTQRIRDGVNVLPYLLPQGYAYFRYTENIFADCYRLLEYRSSTDRTHPYAKRPSDEFIHLLPRMVLENKKHYRLRPQLEDVDGAPCHVLEWPGRDQIWIDANHGFIVRYRKLFLAPDKPITEWYNRDLVEKQPGLWLPSHQETVRYAGPHEPEEWQGKPWYKSTTTPRLISFAELSDDFFKVPVHASERLLVSDAVRGMSYWKHPAGSDPVSQALEDAHVDSTPYAKEFWWLLNGIGLELAIGGYLLWKIKRGRVPVPAPVRPHRVGSE